VVTSYVWVCEVDSKFEDHRMSEEILHVQNEWLSVHFVGFILLGVHG